MAQAPPPPRATGQRIALADCVARAMRLNPDVVTRDAEVAEAEAQRGETRGEFGPKLRAEASLQRWNSAYALPFALAPGQPPAVFPIRDALTWNATVSLIQPITGLIAIYDKYKLRELGVDVASVRREAARRDLAYRVTESYYRLAQAERLVAVASASVEQLEGQLRQSQSLHANGVAAQNDVLRAQLAVAGARQRLIQANAQASFARSRLAVQIGLPSDAAITPDVTDEGAAAGVVPIDASLTIASAEERALRDRVEIRALGKRVDQATLAVSGAKVRLLPQVSAVAVYQHNEGSEFTQTNAGYVGGVASWDVWDWGTTTSGIGVAKAQLRQAEAARAALADQIRLDVRRAYLDLGSAVDALAVARAAVQQGEENYRIVSKRYEASAATSFDVVDAEALLTQARGQLQTSLFDALIARAALAHVIGEAAAP